MSPVSRRVVLQSGAALLLSGSQSVAADSPISAGIVRLDRNESPFGTSPHVAATLRNVLVRASRYPYDDVSTLRASIAAQEGVSPECIYVSEGSAELLKLAAIIYGTPGHEILAARPTFPMLPQYAQRRGAQVVWVDVGADFQPDFRAMQERVGRDTSLIYVCNPNNPTGMLADPDELRRFVQTVSAQALVLVDEAYIDFAPDPQRMSLLDRVKAGDNVMITRSFSKLHGLAGLRIGYGVGRADLIQHFESQRLSFPNVAGVTAAQASLADPAFISAVRQRTLQARQFLAEVFDELKWPYASSDANFIMADPGASRPGFIEFARRHRVMVAPVAEPFSSWIRVSVGGPVDMRAFAHVARAFAAEAGASR